jgi:hypothetical protein
MRQLDRCPHGVGTSKPVDGEDDLAGWAAIDKAYPRSSHSRFPSTPGISRAPSAALGADIDISGLVLCYRPMRASECLFRQVRLPIQIRPHTSIPHFR